MTRSHGPIARPAPRLLLAVAGSLALIVPAACSSGHSGSSSSTASGASSSGASSPGASSTTPTIKSFTFSPNPITVKVGTKVTWTNLDNTDHTVTSDTSGVFDSGHLGTGKTFSFTFTKAGTFVYHCGIHDYMKGMVIVK